MPKTSAGSNLRWPVSQRILGPLALAILLTAINGIDVAPSWSPTIAATFLLYIALPILPMMTLFWVYLSAPGARAIIARFVLRAFGF